MPDFKPSATLIVRKVKPSDDRPFIRKDASGHALYYIVEGQAGVDIGQPERIIIEEKNTVGEVSMVSTVLNALDETVNIESRSADVYAEEDLKLIVFNYSALVEILKDPDPELRGVRVQVMISLNRIMYRKLMGVNDNFVQILTGYGLEQEAEETEYPVRLLDSLNAFLKKMRSIPKLNVVPHELRGTLVREGEPNSEIIFMQEGRVKISKEVEDALTEEKVRIELSIIAGPAILGESSLLNLGSVSVTQVDVIDKVFGYRMAVQSLVRHLQRYPDLFTQFFLLLLELNYYRTVSMMKKTSALG
ncbi:MAG: hypothetical protein FVQ81_03300 [Candidatus Glassbacteria bacterium]|nr:hypothetical protein [Candidatus Glassbacteria bacterium]